MDKIKMAGFGGLIAAGIGSVCCVGPIVLAGLGFGAGTLSLVREMGILHLPMMVLAFGLLGLAFYLNMQRKRSAREGDACCEPGSSKKGRAGVVLWAATGLTVFLVLLPYIL